MKQNKQISICKLLADKIKISAWILMVLFLPFISNSQADSSAPAEPEETSLISPTVNFITIQRVDNSVELRATFTAKIKGTFTKLSGLKVEFFSVSDSTEKKLGEVITDRAGVATLTCKAADIQMDEAGKLNFKLSFAGNKTIEGAEESLSVKRGRLEITPVKEDSVLSVQLKLVDISTGQETPIAETVLSVFVKRMFSGLKLGEGTTDETGTASIEIPNNIPGDEKGNIVLLARLEESDEYGMLEGSVTQPWGVAVSNQINKMPRALWSAQPPLWMLITFIVLMFTVWGHYIVIFYELFRLRKEH